MNSHALVSYISVTLAVVAGVVGMGICFDAVLGDNLHELTLGLPPLLIGLWWAGHELTRGMVAGRVRQARRTRDQAP